MSIVSKTHVNDGLTSFYSRYWRGCDILPEKGPGHDKTTKEAAPHAGT